MCNWKSATFKQKSPNGKKRFQPPRMNSTANRKLYCLRTRSSRSVQWQRSSPPIKTAIYVRKADPNWRPSKRVTHQHIPVKTAVFVRRANNRSPSKIALHQYIKHLRLFIRDKRESSIKDCSTLTRFFTTFRKRSKRKYLFNWSTQAWHFKSHRAKPLNPSWAFNKKPRSTTNCWKASPKLTSNTSSSLKWVTTGRMKLNQDLNLPKAGLWFSSSSHYLNDLLTMLLISVLTLCPLQNRDLPLYFYFQIS